MKKRGFLRKQVDKVRRGTGFDLEDFAKSPRRYLRGRRKSVESRGKPKKSASGDRASCAPEAVYAEIQECPEWYDISRAESLPEDTCASVIPPSPPRSLPPTRRVFGINTIRSRSFSVDEVYGAASNLAIYIEMSATRTEFASASTLLGDVSDHTGRTDHTYVQVGGHN